MQAIQDIAEGEVVLDTAINHAGTEVDIDCFVQKIAEVDAGLSIFAGLSKLSNEEVEEQIDIMQDNFLRLGCESINPPHENYFQPEVYLRRISMPKGQIVIGATHSTEHYNIVLTGKALVLMDGKPVLVEAPSVIKSLPGVRKTLYILEDMEWMTVHTNPTNEEDENTLQDMMTVNPPHRIHEEYRIQNEIRQLDMRRHEQ